MVDLAQHFLPEATILSESGETLGWGSLFSSISGTLFGLVSLWLSLTLSGTSAARLGRWVWRKVSESFHSRSDLALFQVKLVTYKVQTQDLFGVQL